MFERDRNMAREVPMGALNDLKLLPLLHGKENTNFVERANALNRPLRTCSVGGVQARNFRLPD